MYYFMEIGKAYGFFDCRASKEEIEAEIPVIRDLVRVPSQLELSLVEGVDKVKGDSKLSAVVEDAKEAGMRYAMLVKYPDATNRKAAEELSSILNQYYQTPLYEEGEPFRGEVVYQDGANYKFLN